MDQAFVERMKQELLRQKEEIMETLLSENQEFQDLVESIEPKDLADIAADDIDRSTLESIGAQESKRLRLIDSALSRVKNGRYGLCAKCNKKIPEERLNAIPYAFMCIKCKTDEERSRR